MEKSSSGADSLTRLGMWPQHSVIPLSCITELLKLLTESPLLNDSLMVMLDSLSAMRLLVELDLISPWLRRLFIIQTHSATETESNLKTVRIESVSGQTLCILTLKRRTPWTQRLSGLYGTRKTLPRT